MDINMGFEKYRAAADALLLDVRTPVEYGQGHLPGSINLPLHTLDKADEIVDNEEIPLYVYCRSGARSRQAALVLQAMGYHNVTNIGGMSAYTGKVEI